MTTFYSNYVSLCAKKNVSLSAAAEAIGLSRTSPNGWKKGKQPSDTTLAKLAAYFGISVDDLTKEKPALPEENELTETQRMAWDLIKTMNEAQLKAFIAGAKAMLEGGQ